MSPTAAILTEPAFEVAPLVEAADGLAEPAEEEVEELAHAAIANERKRPSSS
jgi:hypothetical protein